MWDSALVVGRTPGPGPEGTPAPPSRCSPEESSPSITRQAGQGAGRGRGRPPHNQCRIPPLGKLFGIKLKHAPPGAYTFSGTPPLAYARGSVVSVPSRDANGAVSFPVMPRTCARPAPRVHDIKVESLA